jgi:methyltransferase (TIGR00027 family)
MRDDSPSATANIVAQNIVLIANTPALSHLVAPEAARLSSWFVHAFSTHGDKFINRSQAGWYQAVRKFYERLTIPGLALHQAVRKLHIEKVVRKSLLDGFDQVVILGGGLDSLSLRLHLEFPQAKFLELDHPATQRVKQCVVRDRQLLGENLKLVPVDFTKQTLEKCIAESVEFRPSTKTVFVCEGVLMYLERNEIDTLFEVIKRQPGPGKRFVFTFMEPDKEGKTNFFNSTWLVHLWLRWKNEPFKWGVSRAKIGEFVEARGFSLKELATDQTLRSLYLSTGNLPKEVLAIGENICVCEC